MMDQEEQFRQFRPYCLVLTTQPSRECLAKLQHLCDQTSPAQLQDLQDYILFPMQIYLKTPTMPENYTLAVLEFISSFYKKCQLQSFFFLKDILNSCLALMAPPKKVSEDLQLSFCCCLEVLLHSSQPSVLTELLTESNNMKLPLSHTIFLCLTWAEEQPAPSVKCSALSLLKALCVSPREDKQVFSLWVDMFVNLLPGITSKLVKVTQDPKIAYAKVKALAVDTWGHYVSTVMSDENFPQIPDMENMEKQPLKDAEWLKNAQAQISQQISILQPLSNHTDVKIRQALLTCVTDLLSTSKTTLEPCFNVIVDIIVTLSVDDQEEISSEAHSVLSRLVESCEDENIESLTSSINKNLYDISKGVGRSLGLYENEKLERSLSLLKGYLTFLRNFEDDSTFFLSQIHLRTLIQSLIKVSEIGEISNILVGGSEDFSNFEFLFKPEYYLTSSRPQKTFIHLNKPRLVQLVVDICFILGNSEAFYIVAQFLLEGIEELDHLKREAVWLLNKVMEGSRSNMIETVTESLTNVMQKYLTINDLGNERAVCKVSNHPVVISDDWTVGLLAVEGLGIVCNILGENIASDIPVVLLHLLSTTNIGSRLAAHVLYFALGDLAAGTGKEIYHLLAENVDHLSRDLNLMLRKWEHSSPGLPTLIRVVLKVSAKDQEQHDLQDTMESLLNHLAVSEEQRTLEILNVVRVFVFGVKEKMESFKDVKSDIIGNSVEDIKGSVAKMILKLEDERFADEQLDIKLSECPSEGFHTAKPDTDDEVPEDDTEEAKPPLTADQKFLQLVISHCRHFISLSGQPSWQLSSLSTVSCCLDLLGSTPHQSPGQAQETLLPLVHQTWHPLRLLFKSTNIFIVDKAFECLMVIAKHARDFVHKRTVTDVFPPLLKFFQTLQLMVSDRDKHTTLAASQSRRILARLSAGVWDLLELLDLQPLETDPIIQLLLEHLGDKLDVAGEENSSHCILEPKRNLDANILWLKLNHKSS
eukprot:GFUD01024522.1.p1 GENE.GFUD01024522.1~~GFUD01024522.1.p1  ORF type:complete len:985 (+),score=312.04 GFUD01024522.1:63-3017(+)